MVLLSISTSPWMTLDNSRQGDDQQREQTASQEHNGASTSFAFVSAPGRSPAALAFRWYRCSLMPSFGRLEDLFPQEPFLQLPLFHGSMMSDAAATQLATDGLGALQHTPTKLFSMLNPFRALRTLQHPFLSETKIEMTHKAGSRQSLASSVPMKLRTTHS